MQGLAFFLLCFLPYLASTQWVYTDGNENLHIAYLGNVSAKYTRLDVSDCTVDLGPNNNSYIYVGVHPSWDPNPFFFEVYHEASTSCGFEDSDCVYIVPTKRQIIWTDDEIYNLDFTTAAEACYSGGKPCGTAETNWYYALAQTFDFSRASISQTQISGETGYSVVFPNTSWVSNGTIVPLVYLAENDDGGTALTDSDCRISDTGIEVEWNTTQHNFSGTLNFTNTTAAVSLSLTGPSFELTLTITGTRNLSANNTNSNWGNFPEIQLDTSNATLPTFEFINGTRTRFSESSSSAGTNAASSGSLLVLIFLVTLSQLF